jgi:hypothetical protein
MLFTFLLRKSGHYPGSEGRMTVTSANKFIPLAPYKATQGKIFTSIYLPVAEPGHTRSIPSGVEPASPNGRIRPGRSGERPTEPGTSAIASGPDLEPENAPTVEPVSRF